MVNAAPKSVTAIWKKEVYEEWVVARRRLMQEARPHFRGDRLPSQVRFTLNPGWDQSIFETQRFHADHVHMLTFTPHFFARRLGSPGALRLGILPFSQKQCRMSTASLPVSQGENAEEVQAGIRELLEESWELNTDQAIEKTYYLKSYTRVLVHTHSADLDLVLI